MVEAPGTAPGSALLILQHVYRHSWRTSLPIIEAMTSVLKDSFALNCLCRVITACFVTFEQKIAQFHGRQVIRLSACTVMHGHAILTERKIGAIVELYVVTVIFCVTRVDKVSIE